MQLSRAARTRQQLLSLSFSLSCPCNTITPAASRPYRVPRTIRHHCPLRLCRPLHARARSREPPRAHPDRSIDRWRRTRRTWSRTTACRSAWTRPARMRLATRRAAGRTAQGRRCSCSTRSAPPHRIQVGSGRAAPPRSSRSSLSRSADCSARGPTPRLRRPPHPYQLTSRRRSWRPPNLLRLLLLRCRVRRRRICRRRRRHPWPLRRVALCSSSPTTWASGPPRPTATRRSSRRRSRRWRRRAPRSPTRWRTHPCARRRAPPS